MLTTSWLKSQATSFEDKLRREIAATATPTSEFMDSFLAAAA